MIFRKLCFFLSLCITAPVLAAQPGIVPKPVKQVFGTGYFVLDNTQLQVDAELDGISEYYAMRVGRLRDFLPGRDDAANVIRISLKEGAAPPEGYEMEIGDDIYITVGDRNGAVYAIETLVQLINPEQHIAAGEMLPVTIPCQTITDYPRYPYRAMHLDIARTYSDKAAVMRYIDNMARHKLNKFHWHLTDDEGWRIEIKSYPRLTEVGAWRGGDSPVKHVYGAWDQRYGGYFTQDDIREVVAYAAFRGIEIIPEIDLPGHSRAAAKAYPEILCGGEVDTGASGDDRRNVWCATREANYEMLDKILGEVAALFPSEYLHVGGDEVDPAPWTACPTCGPVVRAHSDHYLNGEFMSRLYAILAKHGKKQAVWNETMNGGNLPRESVVYGWENVEVCRKALQAGYKTVVMPAQYFYFDMRQAVGEPGMTWGATFTMEKVYGFEPSAVGITAAEQKNIVGIEGAFWAEVFLAHPRAFLDYQTYPRICALAEVAWSPREARDWGDFYKRMTDWHFPRMAAWGIGFRIDPPTAKRVGDRIVANPPFPGAEVRYTTDGSVPEKDSPLADDIRAVPGETYRFRAFYGPATSSAAWVEGYKEPVITPAYKLTSSLKWQGKFPTANAEDNNTRTHARTTKTCAPGDTFIWTFVRPVDADEITVKTGSNHMGRYVVPTGRLEVSYDGVNYEVVEPHFSVVATIKPKPGLRVIRLINESADNGEDSVIIQDLKILAR